VKQHVWKAGAALGSPSPQPLESSTTSLFFFQSRLSVVGNCSSLLDLVAGRHCTILVGVELATVAVVTDAPFVDAEADLD